MQHFDGFMKYCSNSSALAMGLLQSCTNQLDINLTLLMPDRYFSCHIDIELTLCPGPHLYTKMSSYHYWHFQHRNKGVSWLSYIYNGNTIPGKTAVTLKLDQGLCSLVYYNEAILYSALTLFDMKWNVIKALKYTPLIHASPVWQKFIYD